MMGGGKERRRRKEKRKKKLAILLDLHVLSTPKHEKVVFHIPCVCI
jgi:hypothetical protein